MQAHPSLLKGARQLLKPTVIRLSALRLAWWIAFGKMVAVRVRDQKLAQVASSLTFTTVLSLVPMVTVALAIFTVFPGFEQFQQNLQSYFVQSFLPENMQESILRYINLFAAKAKGLTAVGVSFLVLTAMATMLTVDRVFNEIWHVHRPRSLVTKLMLYWTMITLSPLLVGASLSISSFVFNQSLGGVVNIRGLTSLLFAGVPYVLTVLAFTLLYVTIPNRPVRWTDGLLGGALAALLFELFKSGFAYYVTHFGGYTKLYGALAAFPVFLLWIYLSWIIVLLGATVVAALPIARTGHFNHVEKPGERWVLALRVLAELERARRLSNPGLTLEDLRTLSGVPPDALDEILEIVVDQNFVGMVKIESGEEQYALVCDPSHVSVDSLARVLWFDRAVLEAWRTDLPRASEDIEKLIQANFAGKPLIDWLK
jgi:membrane protein